jgi:hypothetical protein
MIGFKMSQVQDLEGAFEESMARNGTNRTEASDDQLKE